MNRDHNNSGVTLIELLVAMAIVATVASMVYGSYAATSRSLEVYDSRLSCSQQTQLALRLMARQIRCAYAPAEPNDAKAVSQQTGTQPTSVENAAASQTWIEKSGPVFRGDPGNRGGEILQFLTTSGLGGDPAVPQRLSYTRYRYDPAAETLSIDRGAGPGQYSGQDSPPQWQLLLNGVKGIDLAFHDGRQWQPRWDYAQAKGLPRAVKIDLTVVGENSREYRLGTTAGIGCRAAVPQTSKRTVGGQKP
jgi:prepilin-type N-terminal cleavage/methylation domain-containing protein